MTNQTPEGDRSELAHKAVRARSLIDPLGAKGFRKPSDRIRREANARRLAFVMAMATFAGTFGAIVATAPEPAAQPVPPTETTGKLVSEHLLPATSPDQAPTLIRILQPDQPATQQPVARTRSS